MSAPLTKVENNLQKRWREFEKQGGLDGILLFLQAIAVIIFVIVMACYWSNNVGGVHINHVTY